MKLIETMYERVLVEDVVLGQPLGTPVVYRIKGLNVVATNHSPARPASKFDTETYKRVLIIWK